MLSRNRKFIPHKHISRSVQLGLVVLVSFFLPVLVSAAQAASPFQEILNLPKVVLSETKVIVFENKSVRVVAPLTAHAAGSRKEKTIPTTTPDMAEVEKEAEYASSVTGIRKDYLMGALAVESAMGQNTGQCTYEEVYNGAKDMHDRGILSNRSWQTFLDRQEKIKAIAEDLGYDYEQVKVSCNPNPNLYVGTGGALGLPQFMPDTWFEYLDRVRAITGKEHPDPWDVHDGVLAMALKLADVPGVKEHNIWAERAASKLYLSGTTSWQYDWYASEIQYWAQNYPKLMTS